MNGCRIEPLRSEGDDRVAEPSGCRWFTAVRRLAVHGARDVATGDEETCAILLAGTFDLVGGTTAWPSRGARSTPWSGRPVAVFLPPRTPLLLRRGSGEVLMIAARQPATPAATGRAALQQSPLLPLAGSGKAFDPTAGEWLPAEAFPTAAESLPPRRIERVQIGATCVERVFGADYKAATLTVDELVVPPGATFATVELTGPAAASECLVYLRATAASTLLPRDGDHGQQLLPAGEHLLVLAGRADLRLRASAAPLYAVIAHAGK